MKIGTPKEKFEGEARVAMTPESAAMLQKLGYDCAVESGAGLAAGFSDDAYRAAGVEVIKTAAALWKAADIVAKVRPPDATELKKATEDKTLIVVEHDMGVVFNLADRISVLVYGEIIATGSPEEVRGDPKVQEAYLGAALEAEH